MKKLKIAVIFGTRPEVIKTASIIRDLQSQKEEIETFIISTGQHDQMLKQMLTTFEITPDYNLDIMLQNQSLFHISISLLKKIEDILKKENPDLIIVQGDTTTSLFAALASFYMKIPIVHIESGYRSYEKYNPFPEEMNRQLIDVLADVYFATTNLCKQNLVREGKPKERIWVTGSTAVDAALLTTKQNSYFSTKGSSRVDFENKKILLLTCHRRESWGKKMEGIFIGIRKAVEEFKELEVVFPVHLSSKVRVTAQNIFAQTHRVHLFPPLEYNDLIMVLKRCYFVATDSGGIVEEAAFFRKPILILRLLTEKLEAVEARSAIVTGITKKEVYESVKKILDNKHLYKKMTEGKNPYGNGQASKVILKITRALFGSKIH